MFDPNSIIDFINNNLVPTELPEVEQIPSVSPTACSTFDELCQYFAEYIEWAPIHRESLAFSLAVNFSLNLPGELIWSFLVGPPSSGKTLMTTAISADTSRYYTLSKMTGLYSGFRGDSISNKNGEQKKGSKKEESGSLITKINGKTLILPDFTTVSGMSPQTLINLLGELRDVYEGKASVHYRNKVSEEHDNIQFAILAAVTDDIHKLNMSELGERFLKFDVSSEELREHKFVKAAIQSDINAMMAAFGGEVFEDRRPWMKPIQAMAWGFQNHIQSIFNAGAFRPQFPGMALDRVIALGKFISEIRANVSKGKQNELHYRPRAEHPTRLSKQLSKVALSLAMIHQSDVDNNVMQSIFKVASDTAYGYPLDITKHIYNVQRKDPDRGLTVNVLKKRLETSEGTTRRYLEKLMDLKVLIRNRYSNNSGMGGARISEYLLHPRIFECYHFALTGRLYEPQRITSKTLQPKTLQPKRIEGKVPAQWTVKKPSE